MTVAAVLTGPTRAAVAVIAIGNDQGNALLSRGFQAATNRPLVENEIRYGVWQIGDDAAAESVVAVDCGRYSEIHCHGGTAAVERILDDLRTLGATILQPAQWWQVVADPSPTAGLEAEILGVLAQTVSQACAARVLTQLSLGLVPWTQQSLAAVNPPPDAAVDSEVLAAIRNQAADLLARERIGRHLTEPWRVVIAGHPNVGKSSLINALVGFERSIAFDQPGTTRDVLEVQTVIDGWPVRLSDTAGLRSNTDSALESAGIELAMAEIDAADLIVWVHDSSQASPSAVPTALAGKPLLRVLNKIDRRTESSPEQAATLPLGESSPSEERDEVIETSATLAIGIDTLRQAIVVPLQPPPQPAATIRDSLPLTDRQLHWLREIAATTSVQSLHTALVRLADGDSIHPGVGLLRGIG